MPMQGYIGQGDTDNVEAAQQAVYTAPSDPDQVKRVLFAGGPGGMLTGNILQAGQHFLSDQAQYLAPGQTPVKTYLSPDEANAQYGIPGHLNFTAPVSQSEAEWKQQNKRDELYRQTILSRADGVNGFEKFTNSLAGGILDPVSLAMNFIPIVGEAHDAQVAAQTGLAARMARGAWAGAQIGAVQTATEAGVQTYQGKTYTPEEGAMSILSASTFGAGFEGLGYGLSRAFGKSGTAAPAGPYSDLLANAARTHGISESYLAQTMNIESRGNADAQAPGSSAGGLFQFTDGTWARMGGGDKFDPALNIDRAAQLAAENANVLRQRLGREPSDAELYLAHQQGPEEAAALILHPDDPAVDVLSGAGQKNALSAITGNGGKATMTAGEFTQMWEGHFAGEAASAQPAMPEAAPYPAMPPAISAMDEIDRAGAAVKAVHDLATDNPVDLNELVTQAIDNPRARPALSETTAAPQIPGKYLQDDVATTVRGTDIPVRYALVEARDLIPSHDADLVRNPNYPEEMQPRDRDRAGSQARLLRMESEFNPRRLISSPEAESGAPIIAPDGVVESGNGRVIVLARNAERGSAIYDQYKAALTERGYDLSGMDRPILTRMRTEPMDGPERVKLAREMNADTSERYSTTEQAFADARSLSPEDVQLYQGGDLTHKKNDAYARTFLNKAAAGAENSMVDPVTKRFSQAGIERMQAAMVARAYDSKPLVSAIFETSNPTIKTFGQALADVAPIWAKMRGMAERGELAEGADTTPYLVEAMNFVRHVRDNRLNMADLIDKWRDQADMFATDALTPEALEYLKLMFRDDSFKVQRAADKIAADLQDIAEAAIQSTPQPNLFGDVQTFDVGAQIARLIERGGQENADVTVEPNAGAGHGNAGDGHWLAGDSQAAQGGDLPGLVSLASPVERQGSGTDGGSVSAKANSQGTPAGEAVRAEPKPPAFKLDDPEIQDLQAEIERIRATDPEALSDIPAFDQSDLRQEAVRAAEFCLREGGVK